MPAPAARGARLASIEGLVPAPTDWPAGCRFAPRCPFAAPACRAAAPPLAVVGEADVGRTTRCIRAPLEALAGSLQAEAAP
jgi:peptide/nickel transport system ATP-binding protein